MTSHAQRFLVVVVNKDRARYRARYRAINTITAGINLKTAFPCYQEIRQIFFLI